MPQLNNGEQSVNGVYSSINGSHMSKNERISLNQQFYNTHSPSATLTPGRKSASPHFFHSSDSTFMKSTHNEANHRYFNPIYHHTPNNHHFGYNQTANLNHNNSHQNNHLSLGNQGSSNTGYQFGGSFNHDSYNLKLPTTPTRSKSLSPSLRCVIQPPKLRYKQENTINLEKKETVEKNMNCAKGSDQGPSIQNNSNRESVKDRTDASNKKNLPISPYLFEPIQTSSQISKGKVITEEIKTLKKDNTETKLKTINTLKNNLVVNKSVIDEPVNNEVKGLNTILEACNKPSNISNNKNISLAQAIQPKEIQINDKTDSSLKNFKLPLNMRALNLKNFPPNDTLNSKRHYSAAIQKMKSVSSQSFDESLNILKQSIQTNVNEQLKLVLDKCKRDFIIPALKNFFLNSSEQDAFNSSTDDVSFLIENLVDEARVHYLNEISNKDSEESSRNTSSSEIIEQLSPNVSTSTSPSSPTVSSKRKNTLDEDVAKDKLDQTPSIGKADKVLSEKSKKAKKSKQDNLDISNLKLKFNSETKFVLGKNVNEIFFQQMSNNESVTTNETHKSIYSKYPNIFKYEADAADRQWLTEKTIIKRKNIKCFILIFNEIEELFASIKLEKNTNGNELNHDKAESNCNGISGRLETNALLLKKLKTFNLPDPILYKLNRQYLYRK